MENMFLTAFFSIFVIAIWGACIAFAVVCYVLESIGFYTIARRRGLGAPGLAWVPIGNSWLLGAIADKYDGAVKGKNMKLRVILPIGHAIRIAYVTVFLIWYIGLIGEAIMLGSFSNQALAQIVSEMTLFLLFSLILIAFSVFVYIALWKVYCSCNRKTATTFEVLSIVLGLGAFFIFADRNKDEALPAAPAESRE